MQYDPDCIRKVPPELSVSTGTLFYSMIVLELSVSTGTLFYSMLALELSVSTGSLCLWYDCFGDVSIYWYIICIV